jgi:hypothetical protein
MFSSLRAFQRYIICNFLSPFDPFFIFPIEFRSKSGQQWRNSSGEEGLRFLSLWGPLLVGEMREGGCVVRMDYVCVVRPHM